MSAIDRMVEFTNSYPSDLTVSPLTSRATSYVLDTIAVLLAGLSTPVVKRLISHLPQVNDGDTAYVQLPWTPARYSEPDAAILAGIASHALDFDDVSMLAICHPSAPVIAASLVICGTNRIDGNAFLRAFLLGTEISIRCGQALGFHHYELGFHATATISVLGVAAAVAALLHLDVATTKSALSIATSMSSGLKTQFGTDVKPLHVGLAVANGLRAVRLAQSGISASAAPFERNGWLYAFSGGLVDKWPPDVKFADPFAAYSPGFAQKRFPCCYMMHKIIALVLQLKIKYKLDLALINHINISMSMEAHLPLLYDRPKDGHQAQFSAPYAAIVAFLLDDVTYRSFDTNLVLTQCVQDALERVAITLYHGSGKSIEAVGLAPVSVAIYCNNGREYHAGRTTMPGTPEDPLTIDMVSQKWLNCVSTLPNAAPDATVLKVFDSGLDLLELDDISSWLSVCTQ